MKYLGIDYGSKRVGLALATAGIAFPHGTLKNDGGLYAALAELVQKEKIDAIVVGDTRTLEGHPNPITAEAEVFIERVAEETGLPVERAQEAGSSVAVSEPSLRKRDDAAAAFILQRFLDMKAR